MYRNLRAEGGWLQMTTITTGHELYRADAALMAALAAIDVEQVQCLRLIESACSLTTLKLGAIFTL